MLSDVPGDAVLRLGIGSISGFGLVLPQTKNKYFGANIHSIMADGFFLDSTIGEFSRTYLQQVQDKMNKLCIQLRDREMSHEEKKWLDEQRCIIDMIGDDLVRFGFTMLLEQIDNIGKS